MRPDCGHYGSAPAVVLVLEAAPSFGNTRHTRDLRGSHDGTAPTITGPVTGGQTDKALAELTVARSRELLAGWTSRGFASSRADDAQIFSFAPLGGAP